MNHHRSIAGDSDYLILCISMYNGLLIQDKEENKVFLNPRYKCINEKLEVTERTETISREIQPEERVDQVINFFRLNQMEWKDQFHEYKIMGLFIETIMKAFEFKIELCIHDLVSKSKMICLLQTGFIDDSEEEYSQMFEIYQSQDFRNRKLSDFMDYFFSSRGLECERKPTEPENFRLEDFLKEERKGVQLVGISLMVNRSNFLIDFDNEEDGIMALKEIMDEFYYELDHLFKIQNILIGNSQYRYEEERIDRIKIGFEKNKEEAFYIKSELDQFFVKWDWTGVELLDFVHLKIWNYSSEYDMDFVLEKHLPDLDFNYASCTEQEYESQRERLSYVI
jgi:hypothetical protein